MFRITFNIKKQRKHPKSLGSDSFQLSLTIHELEEEAGISKTTYHGILTENLGMHYVAAISVPLMLSEDQKQNHVDGSKEFVNRANMDDNF
jgi:hypothetical protein